MQDSLHLYFDGLAHPLRLIGCADLTDDFPTLFPDRDYREGRQDDHPLISIQLDAGEYHLSTSWLDETVSYTDKVDVLCDLIAKLALARSSTDLEALYLHAAAVEMHGRAVVFPSQYRAGKSFLTACLVAEGHRYIGDDIVPLVIDSCKVRSAGFSPRLRLPLPGTTDDTSRQFIERHTALAGKRYAYLNLEQALRTEPELRIERNELLNIGAFVLLEREQGAQAWLEELPVATVFQQLIKQNFAREIDGARILATLSQAVSNAQCVRLRYDRADEAVSLLTEHFASWPTRSNVLQFEAESPDPEMITTGAYEISDECFIRNSLVKKIRIEGENFLASPDGKAIYHLNQIGSGIWELLAEPTSKEIIISTLETAFPGTEKSIIDQDVTKILDRFQSKQLVSCRLNNPDNMFYKRN
jgi:hypothetical protein